MTVKYLFIIESPGKQKKIQSMLGNTFKVLSTKGHIADLPKKKIGINIKKDFEPVYEVYPEKKSLVSDIKKWAKKVDVVYLATDLDREGEAIAQRVVEVLPKNTTYKRVVYDSITKSAISKAIEEAGDMNDNLVQSAETRRILDRLVGYKCSFVTKQATGGTSAGRVQSATLRIFSEREKEIRNFVPEEFWPIEAELENSNKNKVIAFIKKPNKYKIKNKKQSDEICDKLKKLPIIVDKYETKEHKIKPYAPFTTSTLYQSASSILGWDSKLTASVAQKLYEAGKCSYIRSDSTFIVPEFINDIRSKIGDKFGQNYLPDKSYFYQNKKNAQEAHEAIRVIDVNEETYGQGNEKKLYELIWNRTVASQMKQMIQLRGKAEFECDNKKYILSSNGNKVLFDGWTKVWEYGSQTDNELPHLDIGEEMKLLKLTSNQHFTQPPPRYTDNSIIKEMEKRGIGRPSTYANTISVLLDRGYVEKQKKVLSATDKGIRVSDFLIESEFCFVDLNFTSEMEDDLDKIASAEKQRTDVLNVFWDRLKNDIENAKKIKEEKSISDYDCPKCKDIDRKGKLVLKHSRFGPFYVCQNQKEHDCDYKCQADRDGVPFEKEEKQKEYSEILCPNCKSPFTIRTSKKGNQYLGCDNFNKDKKCQGFYDLDGNKMVFTKKRKKK